LPTGYRKDSTDLARRYGPHRHGTFLNHALEGGESFSLSTAGELLAHPLPVFMPALWVAGRDRHENIPFSPCQEEADP
jgi:hypothetical protein